MIQRLVGRVVLVTVIVFGLYYVWSHYTGVNGRFGCDVLGAGIAHAEPEPCPSGIEQAAGDPTWAARRLATIAHDKLTTGLLYEVDGTEHRFTSGPEEMVGRIDALLHASGVIAMPAVGAYSCTQVIGVLLPAGASLTVWWPGGRMLTFTGRS